MAQLQCGATALFPENSNPPDLSMSGAYCTPTDRRQRRAKKRLKPEGTGAEHLGEGVHDPPELEAGHPGAAPGRTTPPPQGPAPPTRPPPPPAATSSARHSPDARGRARVATPASLARTSLGGESGTRPVRTGASGRTPAGGPAAGAGAATTAAPAAPASEPVAPMPAGYP